MAPLKALVVVAAIAAFLELAMGKNYDVGPTGQWDQTSNYATWASSIKFVPGDTLTFKYTSTHDVVEVTKANYDSCSTSNAIDTHTGGNTVIPLNSTGNRYFICGTPGHCASGMKVEISVAAASSPPTTSPGTPPTLSPPGSAGPSGSPAPPTPPGASAPPPEQSATNSLNTVQAKFAMIFGFGLLMILAF
ncbi:uclacyanin-2-like [Phoenix dactylifera]|uniref:Uclacyanin-2-like n=1 Tax=Phoenix dactylifera TaxID=42345 RepID=A0A8B7BGS2_PHODC|nr:uclacyanin-2-like [Phoenix dactylifera]